MATHRIIAKPIDLNEIVSTQPSPDSCLVLMEYTEPPRSGRAEIHNAESMRAPPKKSWLNTWIGDWKMTYHDLREVIKLRKKLEIHGYPYSRLIVNQIGDGLVNAAIGGVLLSTIQTNILVASLLPFGIRATELITALVLNQFMASQRREARLCTVGSQESIQVKKKATQQIIESGWYDLIGGASIIGAAGILLTRKPSASVLGLSALVTLCQTVSKFKEMAWGTLRYATSPDEETHQQQIDLLEPMAAYEMAVSVGTMTLTYLIGFMIIFGCSHPEEENTQVRQEALIATLAEAILGTVLMVGTKFAFMRDEAKSMTEQLEDTSQEEISIDTRLAELDKKIIDLQTESARLRKQITPQASPFCSEV